MIIKYSPLPDVLTRVILAPLIPVTFVHKEYDLPTLALVDSGATGAVISTVIAEDLYINWRALPEQIGFSRQEISDSADMMNCSLKFSIINLS